jgi:hypothetical protein
MNNLQNLQSFVAKHERKFLAKVEATAIVGRLGMSYWHAPADEASDPFSTRTYRAILGHRYMSPRVDAPAWPLRYETTPHN